MLDRKNALLIVTVLVIVAIVGLYVPYIQTRNVSQKVLPAPANEGESTVTIMYTNKGFEPNSISVKVGSLVEWINTSDKPMWVASDPHPSHTNLPGFDERGTEGQEKESGLIPKAQAHVGVTHYQYTFNQVGEWKYHNHLNPNDRGVVVVTP